MAQKPDEIREDIDAERARLEDDLEEIGQRMKDAVDWRNWYRKNTVAIHGASVAGGFLISVAIRRLSKAREASRDATGRFLGEEPEKGKAKRARVRSEIGAKFSHHMSKVTDIVDNALGALLGVAANRLQDYVSQVVPGFKEQYHEAQRMKSRGYNGRGPSL